MLTRKIIVIDEELDRALGTVCDAALKAAGMQILPAVSTMIKSIVEEDVPDSQP